MNFFAIRSTRGDFVPTNAARFQDWANGLVTYITPARVTAWDIPSATMSRVFDLLDTFNELQDNFPNDPTREQTERRNAAQRALTSEIRELVRFYLRRKVVTDADLKAMGIPPIDTIRTAHKNVTETVDFRIVINGTNNIIVDFRQSGAIHRAKPAGYDGAVLVWAISETEPKRDEEYNFHSLASRTPYTIEFDNQMSGKRVWVRAMWQNARGITGRLSEAQTAIIP